MAVIWLAAIGIGALVLAAICFWFYRDQKKELGLMAIETTPAGEVAQLPVGSPVEVKGLLRCETPIIGKYSEKPCAHFEAKLTRDYVHYEYRQGKPHRKRGSETVESTVLSAPFFVEDESGRVAVDTKDATVEGVTAVDRFEKHVEDHSGESWGQSALRALSTNEETIGYRYQEMHIPLDVALYVLGAKAASGGVGAPISGSYVISTKSEEARAAETASSAKWTMVVAVVSLVVGLVSSGSAYWMFMHSNGSSRGTHDAVEAPATPASPVEPEDP